jgi:thiol-disulfide isomerase/thioredoxin
MKYAAIVLSCLFILAAAGCGKKKDSTSLQKTSDSISATGASKNVSSIVSVVARDNGKVPLFSWTDENGKKITIDEFASGGGVLVNFWATWCGPCRKEIPDLVSLDEAYRSQGVKVLGISVDRDGDVMATVSEYVNGAGIKYPIVIDNGDLEKAFGGIRGIPTTFLVDKNGMITKRMIGLQSRAIFSQAMDAVKP